MFLVWLDRTIDKYYKVSKYTPDMVDLIQFEKNLLYYREHDMKPSGVPPIPNLSRPYGNQWTEAEMQAMLKNRMQAHAILRRVFPSDVTEKRGS